MSILSTPCASTEVFLITKLILYLFTKNLPKDSYFSKTLSMAYKIIHNMTPAYLSRLPIYHCFPSYTLYFSHALTVFTPLPLGLCTYSSLWPQLTHSSSYFWSQHRRYHFLRKDPGPKVPCTPIKPRKPANSDHAIIYFVCLYQGLVNYTHRPNPDFCLFVQSVS